LGDAAIFNGQIVIRNVLGQTLENINHTSGITGIDVSSWPSGIYFVTAGLKNGGSIQKKVRIGTR
jgi:hypothetical protein